MTKHKIGIIGFGKIARDQHAPAIMGSADFELAGVSNLGEGAPPSGVPGFNTYAEMFAAVPDMDCVAICTPPGPRRQIAADCLAAGKHVLLEKPPAGTVAEVNDIGLRARAAGKVAFATYHAQHNAAVKMAADTLHGKRVKSLAVTWKEDIRRWHPGQDWILAAGGFGIFDPGINALSILTRIMPEPIFIASAELFVPANRQAPIAANLTFASASDASQLMKAQLDWRQTGPQSWDIAVETDEGLKLTLSNGGSQLDIPGQPSFIGPPDEYPDIYREFASLLAASTLEINSAPFQLVADAFMIGSRTRVDDFSF